MSRLFLDLLDPSDENQACCGSILPEAAPNGAAWVIEQSLVEESIMTEKIVNPETDDARSSDTPETNKRRDALAKTAREGLHKAVSESDLKAK